MSHRDLAGTFPLLALLLALLSSAALASVTHPNIERGFSADSSYALGDIDHVSLFNGNLIITFPLGIEYSAGGDLRYRFNLVYNGKPFDMSTFCPGAECYPRARVNGHANAGLGWQVHLGALEAPYSDMNPTEDWVYVAGDGSEHTFHPKLHETDPSGQVVVYYTRDGSYLRFNQSHRRIEFPDGTFHTFDLEGRLTRMDDRFGNSVTVARATVGGQRVWTIADSTGRQHQLVFTEPVIDGRDILLLQEARLSAFGGGTAVYDFAYDTVIVERPSPHVDYHVDPNETDVDVAVRLLRSMTLPDDSQLAMPGAADEAYHLDRSLAPRASGNLRRLVLPTLGSLEWDWGGPYEFPSGSVHVDADAGKGAALQYLTKSAGVTSRRTYDADGTLLGAWTYEQELVKSAEYPEKQPSESWTLLTTPAGHKTRHYFSVRASDDPSDTPSASRYAYGLPFTPRTNVMSGTRFLSTEVLDAEDEVLRSSYALYGWDTPGVDPGGASARQIWDLNRRVTKERTVYHDDGDRFADVDYSDFDGLGHYRMTQTGGNFPGVDEHTTYVAYNMGLTTPGVWPESDPWVLGTYGLRTVKEGNGPTAQTTYCFATATGYLKRVRTLVGTSPGATDLVTVFEDNDDDGLVDVEESFGGDLQEVNTGLDLCNLGLPSDPAYRKVHTYADGSLATSRYTNPDGSGTGIQFFNVDRTIDGSTGLPSAVRDVSGISATLVYDDFGRLTAMTPQTGHGAKTRYVYNPAMSAGDLADITIQSLDGSTVLTESTVELDAFGRVIEERQKRPGNTWVARSTEYDAMGRKTRVSEWHPDDENPSHWTEYRNYDAFGRPGTIRPPDGAAHDITKTYAGVRLVSTTTMVATGNSGGETASTRTELYDRQGRLYQVIEPSLSGPTPDVTTTYSYDVGNRLAKVSTPVGTQLLQERTFTYDHRGFLLSESHPEKASAVLYADHDALGHARRKTDGASDLRFGFDAAERLVEVRDYVTDAPAEGNLWKRFTYATTNSSVSDATSYTKGKLTEATRWNRYRLGPPLAAGEIFSDGFECGDTTAWTGLPSCGITTLEVSVVEDYAYAGVAGRVSQRDTQVKLGNSPGETFTQSWAYDPLGNVGTTGYPRCDFSRCTGDVGAGSARNVARSYDQGLLVGVTGYASSIDYHPSGLPYRVYHSGSAPRWVQEADPDGMARPRSITAKTDEQTYWSTGNHVYDGAGNIEKIGDSRFVYDHVNRLVSASVSLDLLGVGAQTELEQGYTFDAYGNLTAVSVTNGRAIPTDSSTNRLNGAVTYDVAGNLTGWNGNEYDYDPLHMMTQYRTAAGHESLYVYTADDERIWARSWTDGSGRYTLRDLGNQVLREYSVLADEWRLERDYIYQNGHLLAAETPQGRHHFYPDHLGTPRFITDNAGNQLAHHVYFPFGEEATSPTQNAERLKFTGHERDLGDLSGTGDDLDYMHARFCSPLTGRFLTTDPINSAIPTTPQSWNKYAYVFNNPMNFVDPTGEYGRGTGFSEEDWKKFNRSQQEAAGRMERHAKKLETKAGKLEEKGKSEKAAELRTAAGHLSAGAEVLRSDGSDGRVANAVSQTTYQSMGGSANGAAFVAGHGPIVTVNIDHPNWASSGMQAQRSIGHESLHTVGLSDQRGPNGAIAYQYGPRPSQEAFRELQRTPLALINPDHLMDLVY